MRSTVIISIALFLVACASTRESAESGRSSSANASSNAEKERSKPTEASTSNPSPSDGTTSQQDTRGEKHARPDSGTSSASPSKEDPSDGDESSTGAELGRDSEGDSEGSSERRAGAVVEGMSREEAADAIHRLFEEGERSRKVVIEVRTTLDYGCPCPTWTFAPLYSGPPHGFPYAMVLPGDELADEPLDYAVARVIYRMRGHFDGRKMNGIEWVEALGSKPPTYPDEHIEPALDEYWRRESPVFVVEDWCYIPKSFDYENERLDKLQDQTPTCEEEPVGGGGD